MKTPPYPIDLNTTTFQDRFVYITNERASENQPKTRTRYHVIMLTGNPGCIAYYHEFLAYLWRDLTSTREDAEMSIYGVPLSGFSQYQGFTFFPGTGARGLQAQIEYLESCIEAYIERHDDEDVDCRHRVVLVGHSVGGYMGLELLRRHQSKSRQGEDRGFQIIGYVGLWPTVTHLVHSIRGRRFGWLLKLPLVAFLLSMLAKLLLFLIGRSIIGEVLKIAGFSKQAAEVTVKFLASRNGVYQALYLAGDEMREITTDRWDEDIWGVEKPSAAYPRPKLIFCFGTNDHWVSDHHRDQLIAIRGRSAGSEDWRPTMLIDETGIPHGFCINHSEVVAGMTAGWIHDIVSKDQADQ